MRAQTIKIKGGCSDKNHQHFAYMVMVRDYGLFWFISEYIKDDSIHKRRALKLGSRINEH